MRKRILSTYFTLLISSSFILSQDLDSIVNSMSRPVEPSYILSTFKSTRLVLGQSVEIPVEKDLTFIISHRFGNIKGGFYDLFGLDQAYNRLGLEYGISDRFGASFGRNNLEKVYDGALKVKLLRQQEGIKNVPLSLTMYGGMFVNTLKWEDPEEENPFSSRLSYVYQLMLARKFSKKISLQLTPSYIHKNLVEKETDYNNIFALGMGGKYNFVRKISVNLEYFLLVQDMSEQDLTNSFSIGFDFETGGHVFQLNISNSTGITEENFIAGTTDKWLDGNLYLGFNIYRVFPLSEKRKNIY